MREDICLERRRVTFPFRRWWYTRGYRVWAYKAQIESLPTSHCTEAVLIVGVGKATCSHYWKSQNRAGYLTCKFVGTCPPVDEYNSIWWLIGIDYSKRRILKWAVDWLKQKNSLVIEDPPIARFLLEMSGFHGLADHTPFYGLRMADGRMGKITNPAWVGAQPVRAWPVSWMGFKNRRLAPMQCSIVVAWFLQNIILQPRRSGVMSCLSANFGRGGMILEFHRYASFFLAALWRELSVAGALIPILSYSYSQPGLSWPGKRGWIG